MPANRRWTEKPAPKNCASFRKAKELFLIPSVRLLIIDDCSAMRKMVERALSMADVEITQVFEAGNGKEALAVLQNNAVDLILCDINMPEMDGLEFLECRPAEGNAKGVPVPAP